MFQIQIFQLFLLLFTFSSVRCTLLPETDSKANVAHPRKINGLQEAIMKENWYKSVELMKKHLDHSTEAYRQLNNITDYYDYPIKVIIRGYIELLQVMLDNGLRINEIQDNTGNTLLHYAIIYEQYNLVKFLIRRGADMNVRTWDGDTPLHTAAQLGHANVAQLLVISGADLDTPNNVGYTPLHVAASLGHVKIVQHLIEGGADINATDKYRNTPLHEAVKRGHTLVVQWLVDNKCDITIRNTDAKAALYYAPSREIEYIIRNQDSDLHIKY